jgi:hypothetical protein
MIKIVLRVLTNLISWKLLIPNADLSLRSHVLHKENKTIHGQLTRSYPLPKCPFFKPFIIKPRLAVAPPSLVHVYSP